jgi:hypothetical protein
MSGTLSGNFFEAAEISSNVTTRSTATMGNRIIRREIPGQFWNIKLTTTALDQDEMMDLFAFLTAQKGQYESFGIIPPIHGTTRGTGVSGVPLITQAYAAGASTIRANGGSGTLKTGDFIKFSNHDKIYMLITDVNQDASSEDTFEIYPALFSPVNTSTTIIYNNVEFKVMLNSNVSTFKTQSDGIYKLEIDVREDI